MNKKAIELPMSTIVTVIVVLFVLIVVGISFFSQFGAGNKSFDSAQCTQMCTTIRSNMASNVNTVWDQNYWDKAYNSNANSVAVSFCNAGCANTISCIVRGGVGDDLSTSTTVASC